MSATFLEESEIAVLTGRKMKSLQIKALRVMGVPFRVNATGHPVVCRSHVEGSRQEPQAIKQAWAPRVLRTG